jgi:Zn-finger nucleic acid-binding protein
MIAGRKSQFTCPACGDGHLLVSRAWGDVSALECRRCAGLWLSNKSFRELSDQTAAEGMHVENHDRCQQARLPETDVPPPVDAARYRPCPVCRQLMIPQQFGRQSGVIVDVCKYHGVWFDADELPRILDWIRCGGLARANEEERAQQLQDEEQRRRMARLDAAMANQHTTTLGGPRESFVEAALLALSRILSRHI